MICANPAVPRPPKLRLRFLREELAREGWWRRRQWEGFPGVVGSRQQSLYAKPYRGRLPV